MGGTDHQYLCIDSPVGKLKLEASDHKLVGIHFLNDERNIHKQEASNAVLSETKKQMEEFFNRNRTTFSVPLHLKGTPFEQSVWQELSNIPYGTAISYKELAKQLGNINKVRAVGRANGRNPLPIIIPCHRVIGSDHKLVGYAGGIERKRQLLQFEGALLI